MVSNETNNTNDTSMDVSNVKLVGVKVVCGETLGRNDVKRPQVGDKRQQARTKGKLDSEH